MKDNQNELFPEVNEDGVTIGKITRGEAHSGTKKLHPVVHLHLFNSKGELFLQHRPEWKDIQPNKWDTACGGHVGFGETIEEALKREVSEELGIEGVEMCPIGKYVFESKRERELVYIHKAVYDGEVRTNAEELDGGRFFTKQEIASLIGKEFFTPNFESEYQKFIER
ncbi:MAG: NUDIX domain-containing protein [Paludibacteraceae bacterium]|nr:NUDIX domain-containing protein [Paludibacteraceae bacterium]